MLTEKPATGIQLRRKVGFVDVSFSLLIRALRCAACGARNCGAVVALWHDFAVFRSLARVRQSAKVVA
jgi:hypothetical protein